MNIESAKLSSLATVNGSVESTSPLSNNTGVTSEAFSSTLDTKIVELGNNSAAVVTPPALVGVVVGIVNVLPTVVGLPSTVAADMQSVAMSLGNTLPPSYKIKGQENYEATLATVNDTLKYISAGVTIEAKSLEAIKNPNDVVPINVPLQQIIKDEASGTNLLLQNVSGGDMLVAPVQQSSDGVVTSSLPVLVKNKINEVVETKAPELGNISNVQATMSLPVQIGSNQLSGKLEKKKNEDAGLDELNRQSPGVPMPIVSQVSLSPNVQDLSSAPRILLSDVAVKGGVSSLLLLNSTAVDVKSTQSPKMSDQILQSTATSGQSVQGKQEFASNYFEIALPAEKTTRVDQQLIIGEGGKVFSQSGMDGSQLNKMLTDAKIDLPLISKPLSHPEWNKDFGERIVWMASKAIPSAEIRLNPPHLGPISVSVAVTDDQATVVFTAQHGATRDAIEASLPKLREMMGGQQLNLADVTVNSSVSSDRGGSQAQNFSQAGDGRGSRPLVVDMVDEVEHEIESGRAMVSKGLLSIYA